jgi:hypothetical protein
MWSIRSDDTGGTAAPPPIDAPSEIRLERRFVPPSKIGAGPSRRSCRITSDAQTEQDHAEVDRSFI